VRQVLINLVLNAQQAMGRGGTITINIGQADGFGMVSVSDTGPGIRRRDARSAFQAVCDVEKRERDGLALVKSSWTILAGVSRWNRSLGMAQHSS